MNVPDRLYAGDTLEFTTTVADFPPSDGWTLRYRFVPRFASPSQAPIEFDAAAVGDDYTVLQGPDVTALWTPGAYGWFRWVYKSGARVTLDDLDSRGQLEILQNPATALQGFDNRTTAQRALDEARAALASFTSSNGCVKRYSIAGREMEFQSNAEAVAVVNYWQGQVNKEWRRQVIARTGVDPNRMVVRFR